MKTRLKTWLTAVLFAAVLATACLLDGPSEIDSYRASAAAANDAQKAADTLIRFARAAQAICGGENATYTLIDARTVQCSTKRGFKTIVAKVAL